jgi:hypothetical protein
MDDVSLTEPMWFELKTTQQEDKGLAVNVTCISRCDNLELQSNTKRSCYTKPRIILK